MYWFQIICRSLPDLVDRVVKNLEGSLEAKPRQYGTYVGVQERVDELLERQEMQMTLDLSHCSALEELPSSLGKLTSLRRLSLLEWKNELRDKLQGKCVLLILDDVGEADWKLLPPQNDDARNFLSLSALGPGSIIIITSRDRDILSKAGCSLLEVDFLTPEQSQLLFEEHAGLIKVPPQMVKNVVEKCGNLPLTLKALHRKTTASKDEPKERLVDGTKEQKVVKNKCAPPYKIAEFDILFGSGISTLGCLLDAAETTEVVERRGSWYYYGEEKLAQGREKTLSVLEERPELAEEVEKQTRAALLGDTGAALELVQSESPEEDPDFIKDDDEEALPAAAAA
ncbi:hypothetical protein WJX72_004879 [[Myrmecia] bisecta]|uniref:RecA family profile 2 domain-containing protein n=1 Tax=[Myrmecia] bisecta TaxID=41462 RepID=A0AAW1QQF8_9CHLO